MVQSDWKCLSIICSLAGSRDRARGSLRLEQCQSIICSLAGSRDRARGFRQEQRRSIMFTGRE